MNAFIAASALGLGRDVLAERGVDAAHGADRIAHGICVLDVVDRVRPVLRLERVGAVDHDPESVHERFADALEIDVVAVDPAHFLDQAAARADHFGGIAVGHHQLRVGARQGRFRSARRGTAGAMGS